MRLVASSDYPPSLVSFALQLTTIFDRIYSVNADLLIELMILVSTSLPSVAVINQASILAHCNSVHRFLITRFDLTEDQALIAMKLIVAIYDHADLKPLMVDRGFDLCLLKLILRGNCQAEETQTYVQRLIAEIPVHAKLSRYFESVKELVRVKGKTGLSMFSRDLFHAAFIITSPIRAELLTEMQAAIDAHLQRLAQTEEDCELDYSPITPELQEDSSFTKIGRQQSSR